MNTRLDWFNFAMTLWPYWVAIMAAVATALVAATYAPRRRRAHQNHALIPFREDNGPN